MPSTVTVMDRQLTNRGARTILEMEKARLANAALWGLRTRGRPAVWANDTGKGHAEERTLELEGKWHPPACRVEGHS